MLPPRLALSTRLLVVTLAVVLLALCACPQQVETDIEGNEPGECEDGADNDSDGAFDCDDLDAWGSGSFEGPAGDGATPVVVAFGPAPDGAFAESYGGDAMGDGNCADCEAGRQVQPPACWHYDPGTENIEYCDCTNSNGVNGECP